MKIKTAAIAASAVMAVPTVAAHAGELNLICSADVVICEKLVAAFEAGHPDIDVNMVRLSSGEAYAKVRAEGRNPRPIFGGAALAIRSCRLHRMG